MINYNRDTIIRLVMSKGIEGAEEHIISMSMPATTKLSLLAELYYTYNFKRTKPITNEEEDMFKSIVDSY